jgi:hypothetical protein
MTRFQGERARGTLRASIDRCRSKTTFRVNTGGSLRTSTRPISEHDLSSGLKLMRTRGGGVIDSTSVECSFSMTPLPRWQCPRAAPPAAPLPTAPRRRVIDIKEMNNIRARLIFRVNAYLRVSAHTDARRKRRSFSVGRVVVLNNSLASSCPNVLSNASNAAPHACRSTPHAHGPTPVPRSTQYARLLTVWDARTSAWDRGEDAASVDGYTRMREQTVRERVESTLPLPPPPASRPSRPAPSCRLLPKDPTPHTR